MRMVSLKTNERIRPLKIIGLFCLLLATSSAYSQSLHLDSVNSRFNNFSKKNLQEKIYLHTDKDLYLAGEIIWFKAYNVGSANHRLLDFSKIAYVEVLDKDQLPVLQAKISIDKGTGNGSLQLPSNLSSGSYRIRSYTNWMKNFSPDYFFQKPIQIVNALVKPEIPVNNKAINYDIQFFPEGGDMVGGLTSKIAFRAVDNNGRGIEFTGFIVDDKNDTIANIRPTKYGIGNFTITPDGDRTYTALIRSNGLQTRAQLPKVKQSGFVMSLKENSENLTFNIESNVPTSQEVLVLVHTRQETKFAEKLILDDGKAQLVIDKSKLGEGVSHITLFNASGQPVNERLYFKRPDSKLAFNLRSDKAEYGRRKKVTLELEALSETGNMTSADASMSVYASSGFESGGTDIVNYLLLKSDLKGNVEDPAYYFKSKDGQVNEALDNLMLTHGWRRFVWEDAISNKPYSVKFMPEIDGHIITAKLTDTRTNTPSKGITSYLSIPGKDVRLYTARSDGSGDVMFHTRDIYGPTELVVQNDYKLDSTYHIELASAFSSGLATYPFPAFSLTENFKDQLLAQSIGNQVQNVYQNEKLRTFFANPKDSTSFYLKPDNSYLLDNFVRFNTMEEVLKEYVLEVPVTRQKDDFSIWVSYRPHISYLYKNVEPLVLFDGVPVFDRGTKIVKYDPKKVKSIEILSKKYYQGSGVFNSIINFKSYKNDLPDFQLDNRATVVDYEGVQLRREFYAPVYETESQFLDRLPDFRNVLYWSPDVKIDSSGKKTVSFYTSDQKGKYTVVVQGITSNGKPGSFSSTLEVK